MKFGLVLSPVAFVVGIMIPVAPASASDVIVSKSVCKRIIASADGGAYTPGVDVRGKKVVGVDAGGSSPIKLPKDISFDYGVDLEAKYGLGSTGASTGNPTIGKITIRGNKVYWNGQPLDGGDQGAIAAECARVYGKK